MYATCETPGCSNAGIALEVPPDIDVLCGVCGNPITKISDTAPTPPTEVPEWLL